MRGCSQGGTELHHVTYDAGDDYWHNLRVGRQGSRARRTATDYASSKEMKESETSELLDLVPLVTGLAMAGFLTYTRFCSQNFKKRWGECSSLCPVSASKDPHLHLPHGGVAHVRQQVAQLDAAVGAEGARPQPRRRE